MEQPAAQVVDTSFFGQLTAALVAHPTACILALTLIALAYLYKARDNDHKSFLDFILKKEEAHRATLEKVIPLTENLNQSVTLLARIIDHKDN